MLGEASGACATQIRWVGTPISPPPPGMSGEGGVSVPCLDTLRARVRKRRCASGRAWVYESRDARTGYQYIFKYFDVSGGSATPHQEIISNYILSNRSGGGAPRRISSLDATQNWVVVVGVGALE